MTETRLAFSRTQSVHFLTYHSDEAREWPFYRRLTQLSQEGGTEIFGEKVRLSYPTKLKMAFVGWPKLIRVTRRLIKRSLVHEPPPTTWVVHEHLQAAAVLFDNGARRSGIKLVLLGLIYTTRTNAMLNRLRHFYFSQIFSRIDRVIVNSDVERHAIIQAFPDFSDLFAVARFGLGEHKGMAEYASTRLGERLREGKPVLFSAGRSSRDYETLASAVESMHGDILCRIACDSHTELPSRIASEYVIALRDCFGAAYSEEMVRSDVVVVPLRDSQVSAGQMVAIHALACGKPVVITSTEITREYFGHLECIEFFDAGSVESLRSAIVRSLHNRDRSDFAKHARAAFENEFSASAYADRVHAALFQDCGQSK